MGWIFRTPSDDAVEGTLRQLHMANQVDRVYERTWGWLKAAVCSAIAVLATSGFEYYTDTSVYHETLVWVYEKILALFE
mgnify:FL=1|tara:strand:+ start:1225 stop:1461 length:237 start_codon:yes stop_codon:yes gene_type:complete